MLSRGRPGERVIKEAWSRHVPVGKRGSYRESRRDGQKRMNCRVGLEEGTALVCGRRVATKEACYAGNLLRKASE